MSVRSSLIARRIAAAVGAASLALVVAAPSAGATTPQAPYIDTYSTWDGGSILLPFGKPETSNYGQTITADAGHVNLKWFTFYMAANTGTGTMTMRGEVYGWDGTKATTKVFQSKKKTLDLTQGDPAYYGVKVRTKGVKLTAGKQYVLFMTVDKDFADNPDGLLAQWPVHTTDALPGGNTVWLNSDGDASQWTTVPWSGISTYDMAFKAQLK